MSESETEHDVENEDLLEGQNVFKGPRKIRKNLISKYIDDDDKE